MNSHRVRKRAGALIAFFCAISTEVGAQAPAPATRGSAFALHAGATYARVPDTDFEIVQALSGQDLFSQTEARENTLDFAVFVSQRLWASQTGGARAYATLGTGTRAPGSILYLGGSVAASRALVTAGVATTLVEEGVQAVPDDVFRGSTRTLFADLQRRREWAFFAAVSFGLIQ